MRWDLSCKLASSPDVLLSVSAKKPLVNFLVSPYPSLAFPQPHPGFLFYSPLLWGPVAYHSTLAHYGAEGISWCFLYCRMELDVPGLKTGIHCTPCIHFLGSTAANLPLLGFVVYCWDLIILELSGGGGTLRKAIRKA